MAWPASWNGPDIRLQALSMATPPERWNASCSGLSARTSSASMRWPVASFAVDRRHCCLVSKPAARITGTFSNLGWSLATVAAAAAAAAAAASAGATAGAACGVGAEVAGGGWGGGRATRLGVAGERGGRGVKEKAVGGGALAGKRAYRGGREDGAGP